MIDEFGLLVALKKERPPEDSCIYWNGLCIAYYDNFRALFDG